MKTSFQNRARRAGYSLVEVVVASSILMIGVAAACVLSLTMIGQEETHVRIARAATLVENATRLYQLGLDSSEVLALLPPDQMVSTFTATAQATHALPVGTPEYVSWTLQFYPVPGTGTWSAGTWGGRPDTAVIGNSDVRTIGPVKSYRSSIQP